MMDYSSIDVIDMLSALGVKNITRHGDEVKFSCPFPAHANGDRNPSASMNSESTAFICFGCKERGNAVSFLSNLENISPMLATRFLRQRYEGGWKEPAKGSISREIEERLRHRREAAAESVVLQEKPLNVTVASFSAKAREYMNERGFDDKTLDAWQIGQDPHSGRITIPVRDEYSNLLGFKTRAIEEFHFPKYLVMGGAKYGFEPYEVSKVLFGLHNVIVPEESGEVIIVEGELDCIAMHKHGFTNTVATGSANFSHTQRDIIRRRADRVTVFYDTDEGGNKGVARVIEMLEPYMSVHVVGEHEGDPPTMEKEQINEALKHAISSVSLLLI